MNQIKFGISQITFKYIHVGFFSVIMFYGPHSICLLLWGQFVEKCLSLEMCLGVSSLITFVIFVSSMVKVTTGLGH